jgi:hypothetical protein
VAGPKVRKERRVRVTLDCWLEAALSLEIHVHCLGIRSVFYTMVAMRIFISQYSPPAQCQAEAALLHHPA